MSLFCKVESKISNLAVEKPKTLKTHVDLVPLEPEIVKRYKGTVTGDYVQYFLDAFKPSSLPPTRAVKKRKVLPKVGVGTCQQEVPVELRDLYVMESKDARMRFEKIFPEHEVMVEQAICYKRDDNASMKKHKADCLSKMMKQHGLCPHTKLVNPDLVNECNARGYHFANRKILDEHLKQFHPGAKARETRKTFYVCGFCYRFFCTIPHQKNIGMYTFEIFKRTSQIFELHNNYKCQSKI